MQRLQSAYATQNVNLAYQQLLDATGTPLHNCASVAAQHCVQGMLRPRIHLTKHVHKLLEATGA